MRRDLITKKIKINPCVGRPGFFAPQYVAIESSGAIQVYYFKSKMKFAASLTELVKLYLLKAEQPFAPMWTELKLRYF